MAYFSNQGTPIHSGAAGLGAQLAPDGGTYCRKSVQGLGQDQGALMSYRDGSLGQDQGALMSYRDGSLGQDQGALMSYRDGSLGQDQGALMSYRDGSLGQDQGALMSYRDGSLGKPLFIDGKRVDSPVTITHGVQGCRSCGALGQTAAVLNMKDPEVVRQVKGLMALIAGPTVNDSFPSEMFESGIWGKKSTDYAGAWIVAVGSAIPFDPNKMFTTHEQGMYPTATGIVAMMQMASEAGVLSEEEAQRTVPDIVQFISETQGDPTKGSVAPPRRTEGMKPTTMALIGVGAVAAVGGMWMMGRRRRR